LLLCKAPPDWGFETVDQAESYQSTSSKAYFNRVVGEVKDSKKLEILQRRNIGEFIAME
jgi:hypothetical protein